MDRLEERGAIGGLRHGAELGQEQCEIRPERSAIGKAVRDETKVGAEDGDDLPVWRRPLLGRCRAQKSEVASAEDVLHEVRLADSGFACHEQQPAAPIGGGLERAPELLLLLLAPNQFLHLDSPGQPPASFVRMSRSLVPRRLPNISGIAVFWAATWPAA